MKRIVLIAVGLVVLAAVLSLPNTLPPVSALSPAMPPVKSDTTEYLIALPMPDPDTLDVPVLVCRTNKPMYLLKG